MWDRKGHKKMSHRGAFKGRMVGMAISAFLGCKAKTLQNSMVHYLRCVLLEAA